MKRLEYLSSPLSTACNNAKSDNCDSRVVEILLPDSIYLIQLEVCHIAEYSSMPTKESLH